MLKYFQDMLQNILKEVPKKKMKTKKSRANNFGLAKGKTSIHPEILAPVNNEKHDFENVRHLSKIQKTYQILMQKFVNPSLDLMPQSLKLLNEIKKMDSREQQKMFASLTNILLEKNKQQKLPYPLLHFSEKVLCNSSNNDLSIGKSCQEKTKESLRPIIEFSTKNPNGFTSALFNYKDVNKISSEKSNRFLKGHNKKLKKQKTRKLKRVISIKSSLKSKKAVARVEEIPNLKHHVEKPLKKSSVKNNILIQQNLVGSSKSASHENSSNNESKTENLKEVQNFNITCHNSLDKNYQHLKESKTADVEQNVDVQDERDSKNSLIGISLSELPKNSEFKNTMETNTKTDNKNNDNIPLTINKTFDELYLGENILAEKTIKEQNIDNSANKLSNKKSAEHKCQQEKLCSVNESPRSTVSCMKVNKELPRQKIKDSENIVIEIESCDGQTTKTNQNNLIEKNKPDIYTDNRMRKIIVETEAIPKTDQFERPVALKKNSTFTNNQSNKLRQSSGTHLESQLKENHLNNTHKTKPSSKGNKNKLLTSKRNITNNSQQQLNNSEYMSSNTDKLASCKKLLSKIEVDTSSSSTNEVIKSRPIAHKNDSIYEEHMNKLVDAIKDKIHINRQFLRKFKENFTLKTVQGEIEKAPCNKSIQDLSKNSLNLSTVTDSKYLSKPEQNSRNRSTKLPIENTESSTIKMSESTRMGENVSNKKLNRILKKDISRKSNIANKICLSLQNFINEDKNPTKVSLKNDQIIRLSKTEPLNRPFDKDVKSDVVLPGKTSSKKEKTRESFVKSKILVCNKSDSVNLGSKTKVLEVNKRENNFQQVKNKRVGNKNNSTLMKYQKVAKNLIKSNVAEPLKNDRSKVLKKTNVALSKINPSILMSQFLDQSEISKNNNIDNCLQSTMSKKLVGKNGTKMLHYKVSNDYSKKVRKLHSKRIEPPHLELKMYGEGKKHNAKTDNDVLKTVQVVCESSKGEKNINKTALLPLVKNQCFLVKTNRNDVVQSRDKIFPIMLQNRNLCNVTNKANLIVNYLCRRYTTAVNSTGNNIKRLQINPFVHINGIKSTGVPHCNENNSLLKIKAKTPLVQNNLRATHEKTSKTTSGCKKKEEKERANEGNFGVKSVLVSAENPPLKKNNYSLEILYKRSENSLKMGQKAEKCSKSDYCFTAKNSNILLNFTEMPKTFKENLKPGTSNLKSSSLKKLNNSITAEDTVTEDFKRLKWKSKSERLNSFLLNKSGIEVKSFKKLTLINPASTSNENNTGIKCSKVIASLTNLNAPGVDKTQIHDHDKRFQGLNSSQSNNNAEFSCHKRSKKEFINLNFLNNKSMTDTTKFSQNFSRTSSIPYIEKKKPLISLANKCVSQCYSNSKALTRNSLSEINAFHLNREKSNPEKSTFTIKKPLCVTSFCKTQLQHNTANQSPKTPVQFLIEHQFKQNQETAHESTKNSKVICKTPVLTMHFKRKNDENSNQAVINSHKNSMTKLLNDSRITKNPTTNQAIHGSKFKLIKNNENTGKRGIFSGDNFNIPPNILAQYYKNVNRTVGTEKEKPKQPAKQWRTSQHSEQLQLLKSGINIQPKQALDALTKEMSVQGSARNLKTEPIFKQSITNTDGMNKYASLQNTSKIRTQQKDALLQEPDKKYSNYISTQKYIANPTLNLPISIINHNNNLIKTESLKLQKFQNNKKFDNITKNDNETNSKTPIFPFCRFTNNFIHTQKSKTVDIRKDRKPNTFIEHNISNNQNMNNNIKADHTTHPKGNCSATGKEMKTDLKTELRFITGSSPSFTSNSLPKCNKRKIFSMTKSTGNANIKYKNETSRNEESLQAESKKAINFNKSKQSTNKIPTVKSNKCIEKMFEYGLKKRINSLHSGLITCSDTFKDSCKTKVLETQPSKIKSFTMKRKTLEKLPRPVSLESIVGKLSICSGDISQMKKIIKSSNTFKIFRENKSKKSNKKNYQFVKDVAAKSSENKLVSMNQKKVVPKQYSRSESGRFIKKSHFVVESTNQGSTKLKSSKAKKAHLSDSSRILSKNYITNEKSPVKYNLPIPTSNLIKYCWSH